MLYSGLNTTVKDERHSIGSTKWLGVSPFSGCPGIDCFLFPLLLLYTPDEHKNSKHKCDSFRVREKQSEFKRVD
jgi:hypothetical protein